MFGIFLCIAGTRKLLFKKRNNNGWKRQFRSSLVSVVRFFDKLPLRDVHMQCLRNTPFYSFLLPFIKGNITPGSMHGMQDGTLQFLMTYMKTEHCFEVAGKKLNIDPLEFDLIFGIKSGKKSIGTTKSSPNEWSLVERKFSKYKKIRPGHLKAVLLKNVQSNDVIDIIDIGRIIVIYLLSTVFFVAGGDSVNGWIFRICDDFMDLNEYNWGQAVVEYLMKSVNKNPPEKVRGCTVLLQVTYHKFNLTKTYCF